MELQMYCAWCMANFLNAVSLIRFIGDAIDPEIFNLRGTDAIVKLSERLEQLRETDPSVGVQMNSQFIFNIHAVTLIHGTACCAVHADIELQMRR